MTDASDLKRALTALGCIPAYRMIPLKGRDYPALPGRAILKTNTRTSVQCCQMPDANDLSLDETVTTDKFPYSDRIRVLRRALAKLDLQKPRGELPPRPLF